MVELPVKIILDTSIYIPFINEGIAFPELEPKYARAVTYVSAVVVEELYAGAFDRKSVTLMDRMYKTFDNLGRLIAPDASDWQKAGRIVARMGKKYGFEKLFLARVTHDILIALSARRIGAILATHNMKDFIKIKEFVNFKLYCNCLESFINQE
jgi:predicted nucleic acid-binding protein